MRSRPLVAVTGLTLSLACAGATGHPGGAIREATAEQRAQVGLPLNAWREGDGMIYRAGAGCVVFPSDGVQRPPGMMPDALALDCPPSMRGAAWEACSYGTFSTTEVPGECACAPIGGNPPPPPTRAPCP